MSKENKSLIRRFVDEMLNKRNSAIMKELVASDFIDHDAPPHQTPGPEGIKRTLEELHLSLTDLVVHMDDIIAEGDRVVTRHTAEATHTGPFLGFAPTSRRLRWMAISIYRIADGRIAERWGLIDYRSLGHQLGA